MYQMVYPYLFSSYHKFFLRINISHLYVFHVQMAFLTAQAKKRPKCSLHQQKNYHYQPTNVCFNFNRELNRTVNTTNYPPLLWVGRGEHFKTMNYPLELI